MHQKSSNLAQSGYLLRLTTGENLVLISQTTFEKLKFEHFSLSIPSLVGKKILFKNYSFIHSFSYIFMHFHAFSHIFMHFHTFSYIFIYFHTCTYIFIHFNLFKYDILPKICKKFQFVTSRKLCHLQDLSMLSRSKRNKKYFSQIFVTKYPRHPPSAHPFTTWKGTNTYYKE